MQDNNFPAEFASVTAVNSAMATLNTHVNLKISEVVLGHAIVDNVTIVASAAGVISATGAAPDYDSVACQNYMRV